MFGRALMHTWHTDMGQAFTYEIQDSWNRLFDYILQHMRFGYTKALEEKRAEEEAKEGADDESKDDL